MPFERIIYIVTLSLLSAMWLSALYLYRNPHRFIGWVHRFSARRGKGTAAPRPLPRREDLNPDIIRMMQRFFLAQLIFLPLFGVLFVFIWPH